MARQDTIAPAAGSRRKSKRVGRGVGSGHGRYSCRGLKGQNSRSGGGVAPYFEGGQLPLVKRLPALRGFTNVFKIQYSVVNIGSLSIFEPGSIVSPKELLGSGLVKSASRPIKILAEGSIDRALVVRANGFSRVARERITEAGGRAEVIHAVKAS